MRPHHGHALVFIMYWVLHWSRVAGYDPTGRFLRGGSSETEASSLEGQKILLAAGNFTVDGKSVNIARYNHGLWSFINEMDLHTFAEESGIIRDMVVLPGERHKKETFDLFVVGEFDTATTSSQLSYCSIGDWDGHWGLSKVGEGLCPRGTDPAAPVQMYATTVAGNSTERTLFVGGNFASRVWDGRRFWTFST